MLTVSLVTVIAAVLAQVLAPRVFGFFDTVLARRRLVPAGSPDADAPEAHRWRASVRPVVATRLPDVDAASCEALARAARSGLAASEALEAVFGSAAAGAVNSSLLDPLVTAAVIDGNFDPSALEMVAAVIRDRTACREDIAVAVAQASLSVKVLTVVPVGGVTLFAAFSPRFRQILSSPAMCAVIVTGLGLNWVGRRWMRTLVKRTVPTEQTSVSSIIDHLCVSLRAGHTLTDACERLAVTGDCGASIRSNLGRDQPLQLALRPLSVHFGPDGQRLADTVTAAQRDGQPVVGTIERLAAESRATRRRDTDTRIRQLPGKLAAPLVSCVLPSFMLLSVTPLVVISVGHLSRSLPLAPS